MPDHKLKTIWIPLTAILALGLGWVGGQIGAASAPQVHDSSAELSRELQALGRAQVQTAQALEDLGAALVALQPGPLLPPPTRELVVEASESGLLAGEPLETLARTLESVRVTFERELGETRSLIRAAPAFGGESLTNVRDRRRETDWVALESLERNWRVDTTQADRSQYFQTPRDLLEAYGPPTAIYRPKGGLLFHYRQQPEGVPGPSHYFRLQDGIVIEFFIEDETGEDDS